MNFQPTATKHKNQPAIDHQYQLTVVVNHQASTYAPPSFFPVSPTGTSTVDNLPSSLSSISMLGNKNPSLPFHCARLPGDNPSWLTEQKDSWTKMSIMLYAMLCFSQYVFMYYVFRLRITKMSYFILLVGCGTKYRTRLIITFPACQVHWRPAHLEPALCI